MSGHPQLVCVAGTGCAPDEFLPAVTQLRAVLEPENLAVTGVALPGTGPSELPRVLSLTSPHQAGQQLADWLDTQGSEPMVLVGHSAGGVIAAQAAVAAPSRVAGLVLVDSNMPTSAHALAARQRKRERAGATPTRESFLSAMRESFGALQTVQDERLWAQVSAVLAEADPVVWEQFWPGILSLDTVALWQQVGELGATVPVWYLHSTREVGPQDVPETVQHIELAHLEAGHWVHLRQPTVLAQILAELFLSRD